MMCRGRYQRAKLITAQEMQLRGEARMQEVQTMAEAERKAMERALATAYQSAREDGVAFWEGELAALQTRLEQEVEERCASARSNAFFDPTPFVGRWDLAVGSDGVGAVDGGRWPGGDAGLPSARAAPRPRRRWNRGWCVQC
jgi:hypothetical protein